jgi:hypothetical protein
MTQSKESSVQFSLEELMRIEEERLAEEAASLRRRDQRLAEEAAAAERRRRERGGRLKSIVACGAALALLGVAACEWFYLAHQESDAAAALAREQRLALEHQLALDRVQQALRAQGEALALLGGAVREPAVVSARRGDAAPRNASGQVASSSTARPSVAAHRVAPAASVRTACAHQWDPLCGQLP